MIPIAFPLFAFRRPMGGPNVRALKAWIAQHMPDLDAELGPMRIDQVRERLNQLTGCNVQGCDSVEDSCAVFLAALKDLHGEVTP